MTDYDLGTARGRIVIDYDGKGIRSATQESDTFRDSQGRLRDSMGKYVREAGAAEQATNRLGKSQRSNSDGIADMFKQYLLLRGVFPVLAKGIGIFASAVPAANALAAAIHAIIPIAAAVGAALPGVLLATAAAMGVLKLATLGVADALKAAAAGDAAKLAEALKKLAPNARAFAVAASQVITKLKPLQKAMQNAFFAGTAPLILDYVDALRELGAEAIGVASSFNRLFADVLKFGSSGAAIAPLGQALRGVQAFLDAIRPAIVPLLAAFAGLAGQAGAFGGTIGGIVMQSLTALAGFIAGLDLASIFETAKPVIASLVALVTNLGTIFAAIFASLGADGANALGVIGQLVAQLAGFVSSTAGTAALTALGAALQAIAGGVGQAFLAILQAIAPAIVALSPLVAALAGVLSGGIVAAVTAIAPLLTMVAQALTSALMPVLPTISSLFATLAPIIGTIASALGGALMAALPAVASLMESMAGPIATIAGLLGSVLAPILTALGPVIAVVANVLGQVLGAALTAIMPIFEALLPPITQLVTALLPALAPILQVVAQLFIALLPVILVMSNILTAVLVPVLNLLSPILVLIAQALAVVIGWLVAIIKPITDLIAESTSVKSIQENFTKAFTTIMKVVTTVINFVKNLVSTGIANVKANFALVAGIVSSVIGFFANLRQGVIDKVGAMIAFVAGLPGRITSALGNLAGLLADKGRDIVQGLINGIAGMAGKLASFVSGFVKDHIPGPVAKILGISSPSKVAAALGREVPRGLALGILDQAKVVKDASEQMSNILVNQLGAIPINADIAVGRAFASANGLSSPAAAPPAPTTQDNSTSVSVTVHAPQNMNPAEVGNAVASRTLLKLKTGA